MSYTSSTTMLMTVTLKGRMIIGVTEMAARRLLAHISTVVVVVVSTVQ
jgi:hypothetical protein